MCVRARLINIKKGAFDSQPQVIKFTSCLPMVGGSPASSTTKTGRHDIANIVAVPKKKRKDKQRSTNSAQKTKD
jgi:hypothetical protein